MRHIQRLRTVWRGVKRLNPHDTTASQPRKRINLFLQQCHLISMCMPLRLPDICIWTRLNMSCNLLTVLGWGRTPSIETASWTHETLFCVRCACEEVQDKAHALLMCRDADVCALRRKFVPIQSILKEKKRKERLRRQQYTPCNNKGKGDTLAWSAVSLPHQRKKETVGIWGWLAAPCSRPRPWEQLVFLCVHNAQSDHVLV